jgi:transposase
MLSLPPSVRLFVATQPVDGRKGADSLMVIVRDVFEHDPLSGHLFVFFSKRCDRIRIVYWDRDGFAMWTKRLERGRFRPKFSADGTLAPSCIEAAELALIVEGIDLNGARRRPRWRPGPPSRPTGHRHNSRAALNP